MSIQPKLLTSGDSNSSNNVHNKQLDQSNRDKVDKKIHSEGVLPTNIAKPEEKFSLENKKDFSIKEVDNDDKLIAHEVAIKILNKQEESNLININHEDDADFGNLDLENLTDEELEQLAAQLGEENSQIDEAISQTINEKQEALGEINQNINVVEQNLNVVEQNVDVVDENKDNIEVVENKIDENLESKQKIEIKQEDNKSSESTLQQEQTDVSTELNQNRATLENIPTQPNASQSANTTRSNSAKGAQSISMEAKNAQNAEKIRLIDEHFDKTIKQLKTEHKNNPNPQTLAALENMRENRRNFQEQIDQGRSHQQILSNMYNAQGVSLDQLDMDDFMDALYNFQAITFNFPTPEIDTKKDDKNLKSPDKSDQNTTDRSTKETPKKETLVNVAPEILSAQRLTTESRNNQIKRDAQKLEKETENYEMRITRDRRDNEIKKEEVEKSQDNKDQLESSIKIIKNNKAILSSLSFPVKKETLIMVIGQMRLIHKTLGQKEEPELKTMQRALISMHKEMKHALGVESVGGTGTAPEVHNAK